MMLNRASFRDLQVCGNTHPSGNTRYWETHITVTPDVLQVVEIHRLPSMIVMIFTSFMSAVMPAEILSMVDF